MDVDEEGFKASMEVQRTTARNAREVTNYMGADVTVYESIDPSVTSTFVGYDNLTWESDVTVLTTEDELTDALSEGQKGTVFVMRPRSMRRAAVRRLTQGTSALRKVSLK